jgi:hypothetical protein
MPFGHTEPELTNTTMMDGWMDRWMDERMDECISVWTGNTFSVVLLSHN